MKVLAVRLQNFMAFKDTGWVELNPVTLLFGRNSSGKSAFIRALRLLKQSRSEVQSGSPFAYNVEDGVDVGYFIEMTHGQDKEPYLRYEKKVSFGFRCVTDYKFLKYLEIDVENYEHEPDKYWIDLTLELGCHNDNEQAQLSSLKFESPISAVDGEESRIILSVEYNKDQDDWKFESDFLNDFSQEIIPDYWRFVEIRVGSSFFPYVWVRGGAPIGDETDDYNFIIKLFDHFRKSIVSLFLEHLIFLKPVRPEPKRLYVLDDTKQRQWERQGLGAFLKMIRMKLEETELERVKKWLNNLGFGKDLELKSFSKRKSEAPITEIILKEIDEGLENINLADMGFGTSQVLPVILQSILAEPGSLVVIEQPELHLHPRAQAELADLFVEMARKGVRFLLETHSEHILLRFRRWTTEHATGRKELSSENIYLALNELTPYFIHREKNVSTVTPIEITSDGRFGSIPEGFEDFFSDDLLESVKLEELNMNLEETWGYEYEADD